MRFYRWVKKWAERVAALRIPLYAGNSAFFLLLSLFPLMSILLAILQRTSLQEADVLRLLAQVSPAALMPLFEDLLDGLYDVQPVSLISISAVTVVWSSSKGMYSLLLGLNAVDGVTETRGYLRLRLLGILCTLTQFLSEVYHHRPRIHHRRNDQCREDFIGITGKLVGSEALFVMIFEKIQHFSSYSIDRLPTISELGSRYLMTQYPSQFIVQSYFII